VLDKYIKIFVTIAILLVIIYGITNRNKHHLKQNEKNTTIYNGKTENFKDTYRYILYVINHGSNKLHLKGGQMDGGFVSKEDAPKVACFVAKKLQHKSCPILYDKDAEMFFTSSCGGCHQSNGRGIKGTYPNLTKPLKGILFYK